MADLVDFGIRFRSTGAPTVLLDLDKLRTQTDAAAKSTDRLIGRRGLRAIGPALQRNSFAVTNAANQFSDLAVQISAGVPATRALSQQLPQLTAFMGPVAAILGVVGGVAIGAAGAFFEFTGSAKDNEEQLDNLTDAFDRVIAAQKAAQASAVDLAEQYGTNSAEIQELLDAQLRLEERNLEAQFDGLKSALTAMNPEIQRGTDLLNRMQEGGAGAALASMELRRTFLNLPPEVQAATKAIEAFGDVSIDELEQAADQALATALELESLNDPDFDPIISQLLLFADRAREYLGGVREEAAATVNALARLGGVDVGGSGSEAIVAGQGAGMVGGLGGPGGIIGNRFGGVPLPEEPDIVNEVKARRKSRSGGGSGGQTEAEKELKELERFAEQVFKTTRTNAEKMAEGMTMLDEALAAGLITQDTYGRAVEDLTDKFGESAEALKGLNDDISGEFMDALRSVRDGTKDAGDALLDFVDNVLMTIADKLIQEQIADPLGDALGAFIGGLNFSAKGNAFSGGDLVPFARGGVVSAPTLFPMRGNKTGMMGEAGPEAIVPLRRGGDGNLGIEAQKPVVNVTVNNNSSEDVDVATDPSSGNIEVTVGRLIAKDIASGGPTFQAIKKTFGQTQRTARRG